MIINHPHPETPLHQSHQFQQRAHGNPLLTILIDQAANNESNKMDEI